MGCAPYCRIVLPEVSGVAPLHACIVREERGYIVTDMTAPVQVRENGSSARPSLLLEPGVERRLGVLSIELEAEPQVVQAEPVQVLPAQAEPLQILPARMPLMQELPGHMAQQITANAPMPQSMGAPVQVVPIVINMPTAPPREQKTVIRTSKFTKQEASLLIARFHRHKMHNSCLWMLIWMLLTLLFLIALTCLAIPVFFPEISKEGDKLMESFLKGNLP